jgi:hypothetical protein
MDASSGSCATLLRNLSVPLLFAIAMSLVSARRAARTAAPARSAAQSPDDDEGGVVGATLVALAGIFLCLVAPRLASDPWPLFAGLAVTLALLVVSALRRDWTELVAVGLVAAAGFATLWHESGVPPPQGGAGRLPPAHRQRPGSAAALRHREPSAGDPVVLGRGRRRGPHRDQRGLPASGRRLPDGRAALAPPVGNAPRRRRRPLFLTARILKTPSAPRSPEGH